MTRTASVSPHAATARALTTILGLSALAGCSDFLGLGGGGGGGSGHFAPISTREGVASDTPVLIRDRWLVFLASEATSGTEGTDFNDDGDFGDSIATVVDMRSGRETVLDVAAQQIAILGDEIFFATDEDVDDRDWNLDGFADDLVLLHWNETIGALTFVATLNADGAAPFVTIGNRLYFCEEPAVPLVAPDTSLAFVSQAAPLAPVPVLNVDAANALAPRLIAADEGLVFLFQDEVVEARDLNGDGDQQDRFVLALFDSTDPSARVRSVGLSVADEKVPVRALVTGPNDWLVGFLVNEAAQGDTNLNDPALFGPSWQPPQCVGFEDVDTDDNVLFFLNFAPWDAFPLLNPPVNTGLAGSKRVLAVRGAGLSAGFVATITSEADEGTCSLNFDIATPVAEQDADQDDEMLRWVQAQVPVLPFTDVRQLVAMKSDVPGGSFGVAEMADRFLSVLDEAADSRDHDGFPDVDVTILAKVDPTADALARWVVDQAVGADVFVGPTWMQVTEDRARLLVAMSESVMHLPLNSGDNDLADSTPAFARADPNNPGDIDFPGPALAVDPEFGGLALGGAFAFFRVLESADARDWNRDGDQNDIVLFRTDAATLQHTEFVATLMNNVQDTDAPLAVIGGSAVGAAFFANERAENKDLNHDGDRDDFVLRWFRF